MLLQSCCDPYSKPVLMSFTLFPQIFGTGTRSAVPGWGLRGSRGASVAHVGSGAPSRLQIGSLPAAEGLTALELPWETPVFPLPSGKRRGVHGMAGVSGMVSSTSTKLDSPSDRGGAPLHHFMERLLSRNILPQSFTSIITFRARPLLFPFAVGL